MITETIEHKTNVEMVALKNIVNINFEEENKNKMSNF